METALFTQTFGPPLPDSAMSAEGLGLAASGTLRAAGQAHCTGVFQDGLLSVCSGRENGGDPGGWARFLPAGTRLFASSAFGFLCLSGGEDLWVIDTQYGQVVESDASLAEFFEMICEAELRRDFLREPLWRQWQQLNPAVLRDAWLCPTPAIALGGQWTLASLQTMTPALLLSFTAQLFDAAGPGAVSVRRL